MKAEDILKILKERHSEDVFISQCKDGPSYGGMKQMDAWVMKKSWSNQLSIVYEIKVSRRDFIGDNKWPNYLPYCNQFYFICPHGIILSDELPEEAGLIYVSKTGNRLFTKKKAPHRKVEIPESLYRYILMARCKITASNFNGKQISDAEYWRNWMEQKDENIHFGHMVSKRIRELISKQIDDVCAENGRLRHESDKLEEVREFCNKHGINMEKWNPVDDLRDKFGISRHLVGAINRGIIALKAVKREMGEEEE